jgi:hypothetical protein
MILDLVVLSIVLALIRVEMPVARQLRLETAIGR